MSAIVCAKCGDPLSGSAQKSGRCPHCGAVSPQAPSVQEGTQPNTLVAVGIATLCAVLFYVVGPLYALRETSLHHLFCGHGWVPYALVFLFFVALCILLLKLPLIAREQKAFSLNLLPEEAEGAIDAVSGRQILGRISRLSRRQRSLMLVGRIRQGLLRLDQLGTAEKLDDLLRYRAEADSNTIDSSYATPRFIIWAIPVLGFVGTVLGISNGVQAFSTLIQNASDLEGLRESLKGVTYGLGQAFETTMVALCMSLGLMLIMSVLQRREDRLLAALDDYCLEHLLHKVRIIAPVAAAGGALPAADLAALTQALRELSDRCRELQAVQEAALSQRQASAPAGAAGRK